MLCYVIVFRLRTVGKWIYSLLLYFTYPLQLLYILCFNIYQRGLCKTENDMQVFSLLTLILLSYSKNVFVPALHVFRTRINVHLSFSRLTRNLFHAFKPLCKSLLGHYKIKRLLSSFSGIFSIFTPQHDTAVNQFKMASLRRAKT